MSLNWSSFWRSIMDLPKLLRGPAMHVPTVPDQVRREREADAAVRRSRQLLQKVESKELEVERLHRSMQRLGDENGFASMIVRSLGGGEG